MLQDRRKQSRHPVLVKAVVVVESERLSMICTDIGPAGAFFTSRAAVKPGQTVSVEMRPGGIGSPIVELTAAVVRVSPAGSPWPQGFAVRWRHARCKLGPEPLLKLLQQVLRVQGVTVAEVGDDRIAHFDFGKVGGMYVSTRESQKLAAAKVTEKHAAPVSSDTASGTQVRRVQGTWSQTLIKSAGDTGRPLLKPGAESMPPPQRAPSGPQPLPPRAPSGPQPLPPRTASAPVPQPAPPVQPAATAAPVDIAGRSLRRPDSEATFLGSAVQHTNEPRPHRPPSGGMAPQDQAGYEPSEMFDPLTQEPSVQNDGKWGGETTSELGPEVPSVSWPVYTLAPGERRPSSKFDHVPGSASDEPLSSIRAPASIKRRVGGMEEDTLASLHVPASATGEPTETDDTMGGPTTALGGSPITGTRGPMPLPADTPAPALDRVAAVPPSTTMPPRPAAPHSPTSRGQVFQTSLPPTTPPSTARAATPVTGVEHVILPHRYGTTHGHQPASRDDVRPISNVAGKWPLAPASAPERLAPAATVVAASKAESTPAPGAPASENRLDPKAMRPVDLPCTFQRKNLFVAGWVVGIGQQACAIVTDAEPPKLDEPLVVNMPVPVGGAWRTVYLNGKLLQVAQDTAKGKRFVMHIENVDEGRYAGSFRDYLTAIQRV
jgi:hypothetical protein